MPEWYSTYLSNFMPWLMTAWRFIPSGPGYRYLDSWSWHVDYQHYWTSYSYYTSNLWYFHCHGSFSGLAIGVPTPCAHACLCAFKEILWLLRRLATHRWFSSPLYNYAKTCAKTFSVSSGTWINLIFIYSVEINDFISYYACVYSGCLLLVHVHNLLYYVLLQFIATPEDESPPSLPVEPEGGVPPSLPAAPNGSSQSSQHDPTVSIYGCSHLWVLGFYIRLGPTAT